MAITERAFGGVLGPIMIVVALYERGGSKAKRELSKPPSGVAAVKARVRHPFLKIEDALISIE